MNTTLDNTTPMDFRGFMIHTGVSASVVDEIQDALRSGEARRHLWLTRHPRLVDFYQAYQDLKERGLAIINRRWLEKGVAFFKKSDVELSVRVEDGYMSVGYESRILAWKTNGACSVKLNLRSEEMDVGVPWEDWVVLTPEEEQLLLHYSKGVPPHILFNLFGPED